MNPMNMPIRVMIGGGGTGGHLFPGIAIAQEFMERDAGNEILFVNTGKPFERAALDKAGFRQAFIKAEGIKGRSLPEKWVSAAKIPKGIWESIKIVFRFQPDILLGLGSYASGVVLLSGRMLGKRIVLCEQNRLPGITNRMLFPFADRLYVSFPGTRDRMKSKRVCLTGNPVRRSISEAVSDAVREDSRHFTVLIIGGSQGAHAINAVVTQALSLLSGKERFHFIHQTGTSDAPWVKEAYTAAGVSGTVSSFFDDMGSLYSAADLVICRSGATTVAELTTLGKPALFIPFPFAADDHQTLNAGELADAGAAETLVQERLEANTLAERIEHYAVHPEILAEMSARARAFGRPAAAAAIVDDMYALIEDRRRKAGMRRRGLKE